MSRQKTPWPSQCSFQLIIGECTINVPQRLINCQIFISFILLQFCEFYLCYHSFQRGKKPSNYLYIPLFYSRPCRVLEKSTSLFSYVLPFPSPPCFSTVLPRHLLLDLFPITEEMKSLWWCLAKTDHKHTLLNSFCLRSSKHLCI